MAVHQLINTAWPGDAVTQMAFAAREVLQREVASEVFAWGVHAELLESARPLSELPAPDAGNVLVHHVSIGQPEVTQTLLERDDPLVLAYHNITPDHLLVGSSPEVAVRCHWGRVELELLRDQVLLAVADSSFSANELEDLGYRDVVVAPLGLDPGRLLRQTMPGTPAPGRTPYLLVVAQLLPHKAVEDVLSALHILQAHQRREIGLIVVGHPRDASYAEALNRYAGQLGLREITWAGRVDDPTLAALYRDAAALVSTSKHEGLGVPLLEAMSFGVPVVAVGSTAVPETVGDAGLVLPAGSGPALVAEAVAAVLDDRGLRDQLTQRGRLRAAQFTPASTTSTMLTALAERFR